MKDEPLRFTAALSNGHDLYAFRFSANDKSNSLYYDASGDEVVIVSEPLDDTPNRWKAVPPGHAMVVARTGRPAEIVPFAAERQSRGRIVVRCIPAAGRMPRQFAMQQQIFPATPCTL